MTSIAISTKTSVGNAIFRIAEKYELDPGALADGILHAAVKQRSVSGMNPATLAEDNAALAQLDHSALASPAAPAAPAWKAPEPEPEFDPNEVTITDCAEIPLGK